MSEFQENRLAQIFVLPTKHYPYSMKGGKENFRSKQERESSELQATMSN